MISERMKDIAEGAIRFADSECVKTHPGVAAAHIKGLANLILSAPVAAQLSVPEGWKLVPERIPPKALDAAVTWMGPAMRDAGRDLAYCITQIWNLLLDSAPTPPADEQP